MLPPPAGPLRDALETKARFPTVPIEHLWNIFANEEMESPVEQGSAPPPLAPTVIDDDLLTSAIDKIIMSIFTKSLLAIAVAGLMLSA